MLTSLSLKPLIFQNPSQESIQIRFPKFVGRVSLFSADPLNLDKLTKIKILKDCSLALPQQQSFLAVEVLRRSHNKSLNFFQSRKKLPSKLFLSKFSNLSSLELTLNCSQDLRILSYLRNLKILKVRSASLTPSIQPSHLTFSQKRFQNELVKLTKLQAIHFSGELDSTLVQALSVLDSSLSQLPSLKMIAFDQILDQDQFQNQAEYLNFHFYPLLSQLSLKICYKSSLFQYFINHTKDFSSLQKLSIEFENLQNDSWIPITNLNQLKSLKQFHFSVYGASFVPKNFQLSFLTNFSLPKQIQSIDLSLELIRWSQLIPSNYSQFENFFEESLLFKCFLSQLENLNSLEGLTLRFEVSDLANRQILTDDFVPAILKRTQVLSKLCLIFETYLNKEDENEWDHFSVKEERIFHIPRLFKAVNHLSGSLKELNIEFPFLSLGTFDARFNKFALTDFSLKGNILDPMDFDTIKYLMSKNRSLKNSIHLKHLYVEDEETHEVVLSKLKLLPSYITGAVSIKAKDQLIPDILRHLEYQLKNYKISKKIALEYRFEELDSHNLKPLEFLIKASGAFERLEIKAEDKIFTYDRHDGRTKLLNLHVAQLAHNPPFDDLSISIEDDFEDQDGLVDTDEDLSFFMQNPQGGTEDEEDEESSMAEEDNDGDNFEEENNEEF